jgi:16S rRNA (guanine966-N2)-methyltransferase
MFAGTGSVGLEALSQGAEHVYFIENDRRALLALRANVGRCGAESQATIVAAALPQAVQKLPATRQVDVLFLDPPYASDLAGATLSTLDGCGLLTPDGLIVWQHAVPREPLAVPGYTLWQNKRYGNTQLSFLTPAKKGAP